ncbi:MAG: hypothetical protein NTY66_02970 [Candidatus Vogelbacteria bacterium]|nr:hypothetical protein [Candidatus Vogelbacteria bacterium]
MIFIYLLILLPFTVIHAADPTGYVLLEPGIVGQAKDYAVTSSFLEYISFFYRTILWLAIALAIVYIVVGGIEYLVSATAGGKGGGKKKVTDALIGLVIALLSWLVLFSINPDLVNWNFHICQLGTPDCPPKTTATPPATTLSGGGGTSGGGGGQPPQTSNTGNIAQSPAFQQSLSRMRPQITDIATRNEIPVNANSNIVLQYRPLTIPSNNPNDPPRMINGIDGMRVDGRDLNMSNTERANLTNSYLGPGVSTLSNDQLLTLFNQPLSR